MATAQQCHAMTTYYLNKYKDMYGEYPIVNRNTARWGFDGILHELKTDMAKKLVDFYFTTTSANMHALDWFFYNYDKLLISIKAAEEDAALRARLRAESKQRAEEWRARGNLGIEDTQRGTEE